ncbi:hypothetical protein BDZ89DRAFT_1129518 [Hymenopellis radicata]|nr:hypothetical protein BDZ89DRAFT_1129518 [Hymenopellis radicata]
MLSLIIFALLVSIFIRLVYRPQDSIPSDPAELADLRKALARVEADRDNVAATLWKQNCDIALIVDNAVRDKTQELAQEVWNRDSTISGKDRQMRIFQQSRDEDVAQQTVDSMDRSIRAEKHAEQLEGELRAERLKNFTLEGEKSALALNNTYLSRRISDWENGGIGTNSPAYLRAQVEGREMAIAELQFGLKSLEDHNVCQLLQILDVVSTQFRVDILQEANWLREQLSTPFSPLVVKAIQLLVAHQKREADIERCQAEMANLPSPPPTPPPTRSRKSEGQSSGSEGEYNSSDEEDAGEEGHSGEEDEGSGSEEDEGNGSGEDEGSGSEEGSDSGEEGDCESS